MPVTTRGNRSAIALGPGFLFWAPLGSTEPTDLSTDWAVAWIPLGYTAEGSGFSSQVSYDPVEVAEELDQLAQTPTGREVKFMFSMAEVTAANYKRAMNGGVITVTGTGASQVAKFEPPNMGEETQCMLGWEAEDHKERLILRQALQTGEIQTERKKGADKALIPASFNCFAPTTGLKPFAHLSNRGLS